MCDLIDLNSPDTKSLLGSKLASPLIPVPTDSHGTHLSEPSSLILGKRDSLENNPFDMVLHKTTEYIQKKDDPFEVALERALKPRQKKNLTSRTSSIDLASDLTPKRQKNLHMLRLNRTLDEFMIDKDLDSGIVQKKSLFNGTTEESVIVDLHIGTGGKDFTADNSDSLFKKPNYNVPTIDVQNADLSILNQSGMNDTLSETSYGSDKDQSKCSLQQRVLTCAQNEKTDVEHLITSTINLKVPKLRRCLSQGEKMSPRKIHFLNRTSQLLLDSTTAGSIGTPISSIGSADSTDLLNKGFLRSLCSGSSVFSSLSNISAITRLNSISSTMELTNGTINRTFLESCSSDRTSSLRLSNKMDSIEEAKSSVGNTHCSIFDLADRLNELRVKSSQPVVVEVSANDKSVSELNNHSNSKEPATMVENVDKQHSIYNKLIDVDVFTPELNCSKDHCKNSISDTSSDSVFIEGSKINKSILQEATALARTFEELALRTSSGSSIDDLITSNPLWVSELLPAFDDEPLDQNLIELPASPNINIENTNLNNKEQKEVCDTNGKVGENNIKDLETELIEPARMENKITAATLLFDLKKLIVAENNLEANELLENLEQVLGVKCKNNTELLTAYLNKTNNLAKSPQKSNSSLEIIKNVGPESMEQSQEENLNTDSTESSKGPTFNENVNINDNSISKSIDVNQKCLNEASHNSISLSTRMDTNDTNSTDTTNTSAGRDANKTEDKDKTATSADSTCKKENSNSLNERLAVELLTNLGKLLNGQTEGQVTSDLLRNLGTVLNFASNNCNANNNAETENTYAAIQQTPKKPKLQSEIKKTRSSFLSKSANRLSLDLDTKKKMSNTKLLRRSSSISHSPPIRAVPSPLASKDKSISQLKEVKKRFPSDPGLVNSLSSKKSINSDSDIVKLGPPAKGQRTRSTTPIEKQKEKIATIAGTMKHKLKKKTDADVVTKKGPMRAIHPVGSMQGRDLFSKKIIQSTGNVTPPKLHKIVSSTPNSTNSESTVKKSPRSKPVASSTPDAQSAKTRKVQLQPPSSVKKRNFSCDISPVTTHVNVSSSDVKASPSKMNKLPSPKRRQPESAIPKSLTSPVIKRANSSFEIIRDQKLASSPQRSLKKGLEPRRNSPVPSKKNDEKMHQSPLRDSNKLSPKVKPFNLISRLRRHSSSSGLMEKENYV